MSFVRKKPENSTMSSCRPPLPPKTNRGRISIDSPCLNDFPLFPTQTFPSLTPPQQTKKPPRRSNQTGKSGAHSIMMFLVHFDNPSIPVGWWLCDTRLPVWCLFGECLFTFRNLTCAHKQSQSFNADLRPHAGHGAADSVEAPALFHQRLADPEIHLPQ